MPCLKNTGLKFGRIFMNKLILSLVLVSGLFGGSVKGNLTNGQVAAVQKVIKLYGYSCSSVNFALRSNWSGDIDVTCNNNRYSYLLQDKGGVWRVTVK